jgi:hypothetical protein
MEDAGNAHRRETAIAESDADSIAALAHGCRHVESIVTDGQVVIGGRGRQLLTAYHLAIDSDLIEAEATDIEGGMRHRLVDCKILAQITGADAGVAIQLVGRIGTAYPAGLPVGRLEQGHLPEANLTDGLAPIGDHLHLPVAALAAGQRLTIVANVITAVGPDGAGAP